MIQLLFRAASIVAIVNETVAITPAFNLFLIGKSQMTPLPWTSRSDVII